MVLTITVFNPEVCNSCYSHGSCIWKDTYLPLLSAGQWGWYIGSVYLEMFCWKRFIPILLLQGKLSSLFKDFPWIMTGAANPRSYKLLITGKIPLHVKGLPSDATSNVKLSVCKFQVTPSLLWRDRGTELRSESLRSLALSSGGNAFIICGWLEAILWSLIFDSSSLLHVPRGWRPSLR